MSNSLQITGDGNPWQIEAGGATVGTLAERLGVTPFQGLVWHESDTGRTWLYDGSAWTILHDPAPTDRVTLAPASATDSTSSTTAAQWLTFADVTVPPWATAVEALWTLTGIFAVGASSNFNVSPRLDGATAANSARIFHHFVEGVRGTPSVQGWWTGLTPGDTLTPSLWVAGAGGTAVLRADGSCRFDIIFNWRES